MIIISYILFCTTEISLFLSIFLFFSQALLFDTQIASSIAHYKIFFFRNFIILWFLSTSWCLVDWYVREWTSSFLKKIFFMFSLDPIGGTLVYHQYVIKGVKPKKLDKKAVRFLDSIVILVEYIPIVIIAILGLSYFLRRSMLLSEILFNFAILLILLYILFYLLLNHIIYLYCCQKTQEEWIENDFFKLLFNPWLKIFLMPKYYFSIIREDLLKGDNTSEKNIFV